MTTQLKSIAAVSALLLLGFSATSDAEVGSSRDQLRTHADVQSCIAEIAKRADYDGAARVVHRVTELRQRNLVEVEVKIATSIYSGEAGGETRVYETDCVIGQLGKVVEIRVASPDDTLVSAR